MDETTEDRLAQLKARDLYGVSLEKPSYEPDRLREATREAFDAGWEAAKAHYEADK